MTVKPLATPSPSPILNLTYTGRCGNYYKLYLKMVVLTIITLGIYRFWGKTDVRRYIWSSISFLEDAGAYLGSGSELFKGAIKFLLIMALFSVVAGVISVFFVNDENQVVLLAFKGIAVITLFLFYYAAKFMGMRYRIGRTSWRGIRFELRGSAKTYLVLKAKNLFFNFVSLGLYRPFGDVKVLYYVINNERFGSQPFCYNGQIEELQKTYYLCWLLFLPTFGMSLFWYKAKYIAHVAKYTKLGNMEFRMKFSGGEYMRFVLSNGLYIVLSLGLAYPYILHRRVRFYAQRLHVRGMIDFVSISQSGKKTGSEGAELILGSDDLGF